MYSHNQASVAQLLSDFASVFRMFNTWIALSFQDVYMRYRRSVIGPFWISISQGITIFAAAILYSQIFKIPFKEFLSYVAVGVLAWNALAQLIIDSSNHIIESEGLIKSLPIRIPVLAARLAFRNFIIIIHNVFFFAIILVFFGVKFSYVSIWALAAIPAYLILGFFIAIAIGPISARYRDLALIIQNAIQFAFFLTPILWRADQLPERAIFVHANPFYHAIEIARAPLLDGRLPSVENWSVFGLCVAIAVVGAIISLATTRGRVYFWV